MPQNATPLISTIIPTYNRPALLRRAISSVANQTYRPIEIVVVDDGSDEKVESSWFKIAYQDISIVIHHHIKPLGVSASRNAGIRISKGAYIAFLDDDDHWMPEKLESQLNLLRKLETPRIQAIFCQMIIQDNTGNEIRRTHYSPSNQIIRNSLLFQDGNLPPQTLLIKKEVFNQVGLFDETFRSHEDRQWALRYLSQFRIVLLDRYLVWYVEHQGLRLTSNPEMMLKGEIAFAQFIEEFAGYLGKVPYRKAMGYRYAKLGNEYLLAGYFSQGIKAYGRAILLNPFEFRTWAGFFLGLGGISFYRKILALRMLRVRFAESNRKKEPTLK
jgi:glycosyltransferase involved in cell wall biosynthesis